MTLGAMMARLLVITAVFTQAAASNILISHDPKAGCDLAISYLDLQLICHSPSRPAVSIGKGLFQATDRLGNFDINDTILERVELKEFNQTQDTILLFNSEVGVGLGLSLVELEEEGLFVITLTYPDIWLPALSTYNRIWMELVAEESEYVWGGGEQFTYLNLRGRSYPIWVREQGVGRNLSSSLTQIVEAVNPGAGGDYHTTYWPQASFLSSRRYYMESTHATYHVLDFISTDRHGLYWHLTVPSGADGSACQSCRLAFVMRPSLLEIVEAVSPGQPELPDWVYKGAIIGVQGGTDRMLEVLDAAEGQNVAVSGLWIQDWSGKITTTFGSRVFWNWRWNETWYPELDVLIQDLDLRRGIKVLGYLTAHLNVDGDVYAAASNHTDYWLTVGDGSERLIQDFGEFSVATVDILKPPPDCNCLNMGRDWYKQLIKDNLLGLGLAGWMADFGEYTPTGSRSRFASRWWGEEHRGEVLHQVFSEEWARLNREVVEEAGQLGHALVWMRSGGLASKLSQLMSWAGDQTVDWTASDGLPSSITAALSLAVSGMGLSHSDVGGYTTIAAINLTRSKELLLRWAEYAAFTPLMRTHEGNQPAANHQIYTDEDTLQQFGRLTRLYAALAANYTRAAVRQNAAEHTPVMRPLFLMFEDDPESFLQEYEYMLGDDLLVAPVLLPGVDMWQVYLPGDPSINWYHLWGGQSAGGTGGQMVEVAAPLGEPPVFYRADSQWAALFRAIGDQFKLPKI